jgi:Flp pilus assembly secretin CpaC
VGWTGDGSGPGGNPDLDVLAEVVTSAVERHGQAPRKFAVRDLSHETYQLSCIDAENCLNILGKLGYNTTAPKGEVAIDQLPAVLTLPYGATKSFVGYTAKSGIESRILDQETLSAAENRLMIVYHESQSVEVGRLKDLLSESVDVPAGQVLIEGMVVELSERGFEELGVEWRIFDDNFRFIFAPTLGQIPLLMSVGSDLVMPSDFEGRFSSTLRAIIEEGQAEVLSTPSVLVLDNRNAMFQVIREVPIFNSVITETTTKLEFDFKTVGIILNIKPRISHDGSSVAMQIMVEVSEAPEEDFIEIDGQNIAPLINRRVVQTVARVSDNTPFIIGGLIRNEKGEEISRIPLLSDIPVVGPLFQVRSERDEKREVIIVLTPRVIKPTGTGRPVLPKDSSQFDFLDNRLFRNSYRIKAEDVLDLGFLQRNPTVVQAFADARWLVRQRPEYSAELPFSQLARGVIPGEDAFVIRMIYEIIKRLGLHEAVPAEDLIFLESDPTKPGGFGVKFLTDQPDRPGLLHDVDGNSGDEAYFDLRFPRKIPLLKFNVATDAGLSGAVQTPVADVEWVEVNGEAEMQALDEVIIDANLLDEGYRHREFVIPIRGPEDLMRLRRAVALRETIMVNNFEESLELRFFRVGRRIVIPTLCCEDRRVFLVDHHVAELFFKSDYYYAAMKDALENGYAIIQAALAEEGR